MFTLRGDNGTGIDWDSMAGVVGFELELTGNKLHSATLCAQSKETVLVKWSKTYINLRVKPKLKLDSNKSISATNVSSITSIIYSSFNSFISL